MTDLCSEVRFPEASDVREGEVCEGVGEEEGGGTVRLGRVTSSDALELGRRLLAAARDGHTDLVLDHMAKGAPFTTDWLGTSPLHLAAANNRTAVCAVLLRAGVSRDCRTKVERTPLHLAAYWGHADTADLLLRHGADVGARDMLGMTALHWATERGHAPCARALLRAGADPLAVSRFHTTPLSLARDRPALLSLLEEAVHAREAGRSVSELQEEEAQTEEPDLTQFITVEEATEVNQAEEEDTKFAQNSVNNLQQGVEVEMEGAEGTEAEEEGEGARLLRAHGITLLPADEGTALSALRSGRTLLLSDAGKLMLKESIERPCPAPAAATPATPTAPAAPHPIKLFTLEPGGGGAGGGGGGTSLRDTNITINKFLHSASGKTVKYVALPSAAKIISPKKVQVGKLKSVSAAGQPTSSPATPATPAPHAAVKILLNQTNLHRLIQSGASATKLPVIRVDNVEQQQQQTTTETTEAVEEEDSEDSDSDSSAPVVVVPRAYLTSRDASYLRARLLASHTALARASRDLARARARLARLSRLSRGSRVSRV